LELVNAGAGLVADAVVGCGEENSSGFVRPPSVSLNAGALAAGSVSGPAAFLRKRTCAIGAPRTSPLTAGRLFRKVF
jgi:hypothetical protein